MQHESEWQSNIIWWICLGICVILILASLAGVFTPSSDSTFEDSFNTEEYLQS